MPPSAPSLLSLGPFYWWMLHTHVFIVEIFSSWGLYLLPCTLLRQLWDCEIVRMCEWTSTSCQVTKRVLRVSGRNRKVPLVVFVESGRPCTYNTQYPIAEGNFLRPSHLLLSPPKRQVIYRQNYFGFIHLQGLFSDLGLWFEREAKVFKLYPQFELVPAAEGASFLHFQAMKSGVLNLRPKPKIIVIFPLINNAQLKPWLVTIGTSFWKKINSNLVLRRLAIEGLDAPLLCVVIPRLVSVLPSFVKISCGASHSAPSQKLLWRGEKDRLGKVNWCLPSLPLPSALPSAPQAVPPSAPVFLFFNFHFDTARDDGRPKLTPLQ